MSEERALMVKELKLRVVPELIKMGFTGYFPHYRRINQNKMDLLMFQFDKWGGGFLIEISYVMKDVINRNLCIDDGTPFEKLTVAHTNIRYRLYSEKFDGWFYYFNVAQVNAKGVKLILPVSSAQKESFIENTHGNIKWLQLVDESVYEKLAEEAFSKLKDAEKWWVSRPRENSLTKLKKSVRKLFRKPDKGNDLYL